MYTYCLLVKIKTSFCVCCLRHYQVVLPARVTPRPFRIQKGLILFPFQVSIAVPKRVSGAYTAVKFLAGPPPRKCRLW